MKHSATPCVACGESECGDQEPREEPGLVPNMQNTSGPIDDDRTCIGEAKGEVGLHRPAAEGTEQRAQNSRA